MQGTELKSRWVNRQTIKAGLFGSVGIAGLLVGATAAHASAATCDATPNVTVFTCEPSIKARIEGGDSSLSVDDATITDDGISYYTWANTSPGDITSTLTVRNSTVNVSNNGGVNVSSNIIGRNDIAVTLESSVTVESSAGYGGLWVRNEVAGDITIQNDAALTVSGVEANGIAATTNAGSVRVTNSGAITVNQTSNAADFSQRGIYADGGYNDVAPVEVTVTNTGEIQAQAAGIRVVNYNGLAKITNNASVSSVNNQALVGWTPNGEVVIDNQTLGEAASASGPAIQGASQIGNITITNAGTADGQSGILATAGFDPNVPGSGKITITNTGTVIGRTGKTVQARTPVGDVSISNAGTLKSLSASAVVDADTLNGTVTITNTGSIQGETGIVTNSAATTIVNSGTIDVSPSGHAIVMGAGDVTLELHAGSNIIGLVADADVANGNNTLALGGTVNASFDAALVGAQYTDFDEFVKTGSSTWTLTGAGTTGWTVNEGTLTADSAAAFGVDQAYVVNGGVLKIGAAGARIGRLTGAEGGTVDIGNSGTLTLNVSQDGTYGGSLTGSGSFKKTGNAALTLTGDNSAFAGNIVLTGGETVIDGSAMSGNIVFLGGLDGASLAVANGGTFNAPNIIVGNSSNSITPGLEDESGSLLVSGTQSTVTTDFLTVGYYGEGSLTIENGGTVSVNTVTSVGAGEGSFGSITVSGNDSRLQGGTLQFGGSGQGELVLSGGATMQTTNGSFGVNAGAKGTGTVSGAGTRWEMNKNGLGIGTNGVGILTVSDGATLVSSGSNADVKLGAGSSGQGQLTVSGTGSSVTTTTNFIVGSYGSGNVDVTSQAQIAGDKLIVGFTDGSEGSINVSGAGTLAKGTSYVMVGTYAGSAGAITVSDGATLKSDGGRGVTLAYEAGSTGTLNIGAAAGSAARAAGTIDAVSGIQFGAGAGKLVLNHSDTDYTLAAGLSGTGVVDVLAGTTILTGESSGYSGALNVSAGKLVLANTMAAASTIIGLEGTLQIGNGGTSGSLNGDLENNGLLVFDRSDALHHNRVISGTGDVTVAGGAITLSGMNTFTGATTIDAGATLALSNQGRVNQSSSVTVNGVFDVTKAASVQINDLGGSGTVIVGDAEMMLANASQVFSGRITGTGGVNVSAGTLTLTNASDFEGGLGISNGATVNLGNGGTTGSITANVTNDGTLLFDRANDFSYLGQITGQGSVIKTGDNTLTFGGSMSGGQLDVQQGTALFVGTISNNAHVGEQGKLVFANSATTSYKGTLSGTGTVLKTGTGTITFSGDSSGFAGDATIDGGTVLLTGKLGGTLLIDTAGTLQVGDGVKNGELLADATNNGTLIFNQVGDYDYTGALSGNRGLLKQGDGTLLLSGDYRYTGSTVVQGGRVRLLSQLDSATDLVVDDGEFDLSGTDQTIAGLSGGGGAVNLGTSTLTVNQSTNTVFGGSFGGSGTIIFNGLGASPASINLTGESFDTFTGGLTLESIVMRVNGSMGGTITVGDDAALGGNGKINNLVVANGGTLLPGNSIGTLTAAGNVVFEAGSTYEVEVNANGESDKLIVGGTANIQGGTVSVLAAAGNYRFSSDYTIITAAGGVTGRFAGTDVDLPFLTPELSYDPNNVMLKLVRNDRSFESVAVTPNQLAVALALDASDDDASLSRAVAGQLEEAGAVRAFDALSGELWATTGTLMVDGTRRLGDMAIGRMVQSDVVSRTLVSAGSSARTLHDGSTAIWGRGIGAWSTLKSDGNASKATQSTFGFITGLDTGLGGWRLGVAFAHEQNKVRINGRASEATVTGNSALAYAGGGWGALRARVGASYSWLDVSGKRTVAFLGVDDALSGDYDAKSASAFGEVSYVVPLGTVTAEPFAGVTHVHLSSDAFTETGSALTALGVTDRTHDITYTTLGVRLGAAVPFNATTMLSPRVSAAWLRSYGDVDATSRNILSTGQAFSVAGLPTTRDTLRLEGGVQANIMPGGSIGATYVGNIGDRWDDHGVRIGFSYSF